MKTKFQIAKPKSQKNSKPQTSKKTSGSRLGFGSWNFFGVWDLDFGICSRAFTLIELLVVIAVIAILAALIIPITAAVNRAKVLSRSRGELANIETAIEDYKATRGFYPPDTPGL